MSKLHFFLIKRTAKLPVYRTRLVMFSFSNYQSLAGKECKTGGVEMCSSRLENIFSVHFI